MTIAMIATMTIRRSVVLVTNANTTMTADRDQQPHEVPAVRRYRRRNPDARSSETDRVTQLGHAASPSETAVSAISRALRSASTTDSGVGRRCPVERMQRVGDNVGDRHST